MTGASRGLRIRLLLWGPVALLLAFEFYLSSQSKLPEIPFAGGIPQFDKVEHAGFFFLLGLVAVRAARFGEAWTARRTALTLLGSALVWGVLDEFHQSFVPGRSVEAADVVADVTGVLLAVLVGERFWRFLRMDRVVR
jgi:VanZ family protein